MKNTIKAVKGLEKVYVPVEKDDYYAQHSMALEVEIEEVDVDEDFNLEDYITEIEKEDLIIYNNIDTNHLGIFGTKEEAEDFLVDYYSESDYRYNKNLEVLVKVDTNDFFSIIWDENFEITLHDEKVEFLFSNDFGKQYSEIFETFAKKYFEDEEIDFSEYDEILDFMSENGWEIETEEFTCEFGDKFVISYGKKK